jgi:3-deoxy-manno-octulosonate cytidylyltransferase (CMP-KDO synthetase)
MKVLGIIPARYGSSRFPGKPLIDLNGKTMIQRVYEGVLKSSKINEVIVATDDQRIFDHCTSKKINVVWTKSDHQSGTERCIEVVHQLLKEEKNAVSA